MDAAAENWVDEHGDFLFRFALLRVNSRELAEDLVQETFLSALKSYKNFNRRSSLRTWLVSILKNRIIDHYRKTSAHTTLTESDLKSADENADFDERGRWREGHGPDEWDLQPDRHVQQNEFMAILRACLKLVPALAANVFSLREIDGMDSKQICKDLNISQSNLWVLLHRARKSLRNCLERNWFAGGKEQTV